MKEYTFLEAVEILKEGAVTFQKEYPSSLLKIGSVQQAIPMSHTYVYTFPEEN